MSATTFAEHQPAVTMEASKAPDSTVVGADRAIEPFDQIIVRYRPLRRMG